MKQKEQKQRKTILTKVQNPVFELRLTTFFTPLICIRRFAQMGADDENVLTPICVNLCSSADQYLGAALPRRVHSWFIFLLSALCALWFRPSVLAAYDMSRYEVIMERSPFGKEPPVEESSAPAKPAGEFAKQYRLCMLYQDAAGQLKAGLVSKTNNKNTFLQLGENENGLSLIEVRLEEGVAILQQGGETALLMLEGLGTPPAAPAASAPSAIASAPTGPAQLIRRNGTDEAPAHILAALTDPLPKRPRLTVNESRSFASAGGSTRAPEEDRPNRSGSSRSAVPGKQPITVAQAGRTAKPANYLIQRVPARFNPF